MLLVDMPFTTAKSTNKAERMEMRRVPFSSLLSLATSFGNRGQEAMEGHMQN